MNVLYRLCVLVAGTSLVLVSAVIPWGVFTRYVLNSAASWPEPAAILLTIVLTFIGAAVCYRSRLHMRVGYFVTLWPPLVQRLLNLLAELLMAMIAGFMLYWGAKLVMATWNQSIDAFPSLSVGVTYLPIPIGGLITLLFVIERITLGPPASDAVGVHGA